jgi:pyridinium-3,5-bisthiocarboxylic acid mononucleotide nickel chelatase
VSAPSRSLRHLHLHFEPTSGIAGDMAVAALVDAGVPAAVVKGAVEAMGVRGLRVGFGRRKRGSYVGRSFEVEWPGRSDAGEAAHPAQHDHDHPHPHAHGAPHDHPHVPPRGARNEKGARRPAHDHRDYAEVKRLLARARLDPDARALAGDIFARIAEVEAALHGTRIDRVAFHEVGAYDSIADVVGIAAAISHLSPASIGSLPPVVGTGVVRTAHGPVPVPAPATAALLAEIPILPEGEGELTTPTGAAILAAVVDRFGPLPPMRVRAIGYGAGTRELPDRANVLRVVIGEALGTEDGPAAPEVVLLEANLDDLIPQLVGPLYEALLAAGAVDVWSAPILMKKGRPGLQVSTLAPPEALAAVERAFFDNSTTLGLRRRALERVVLARSFATVETAYGRIRVKLGALDGEILGAQPEFEDCRRLAARARVPAREGVAPLSASARALVPARGGAVGKVPGRRTRRPPA